jgi:membrane-associated phospholipid phosphatase
MNILIKLFAPVALLTYLSVRYVDRPVSLFIHDSLYRNRHWSALTSSLPDMLLLIVILISLPSALLYYYRKRKSLLDAHTRLLGFIALSLPSAYLVKSVLKFITGRVQTRYWLDHQHVYEFHWLQGDAGFNGFPSGHMVVFATLLAAIARYFAGQKLFCYLVLVVLALLLVATNYHFVGDVIAGVYIGLLLESCLDKFYIRHVSLPESRG